MSCVLNAAEKGLGKCMQGCGGRRIKPGYKSSTCDCAYKFIIETVVGGIYASFLTWCDC